MIKYGEVLDYRTADKAVVGKKYIFGDSLRNIQEDPEQYKSHELTEIIKQFGYPFEISNGCRWQFCREVIEEEVLMTNRQLAEWLAKGNGFKGRVDSYDGTISSAYTTHTFGLDYADNQVDQSIRIRSWGSDEWVVPTVEIYEWDCKYEKNCKEASK